MPPATCDTFTLPNTLPPSVRRSAFSFSCLGVRGLGEGAGQQKCGHKARLLRRQQLGEAGSQQVGGRERLQRLRRGERASKARRTAQPRL